MAKNKATAFDLKLALLKYYRFKRQWLCVDEFRGADIIVDTGREIIEAEVKVTKSDLINGEKKKAWKHQSYNVGGSYNRNRPNKFLFCVPERLVVDALEWANDLNSNYGVMGFNEETFMAGVRDNAVYWLACNCFLRTAKSAKSLHKNYNNDLRWAIAKRTSAKIVSLMEDKFKSFLPQQEIADGKN